MPVQEPRQLSTWSCGAGGVLEPGQVRGQRDSPGHLLVPTTGTGSDTETVAVTEAMSPSVRPCTVLTPGAASTPACGCFRRHSLQCIMAACGCRGPGGAQGAAHLGTSIKAWVSLCSQPWAAPAGLGAEGCWAGLGRP